jgi:hypothetical protein
MSPVDIVVTTIYEPAWLRGYLDNLRRHGRDQSTRLSIIVDRKTPPTVQAAAAAARAEGFDVWCPTLDEQAAYLQRLAAPADFVPWDTDNRRNIGFLAALERGVGTLISIDDDNYCQPDVDFVGAHLAVGHRAGPDDRRASGAPWFNICGLLEHEPAVPIFPRGFPYEARARPPAQLADGAGDRVVAINAGLWLDDPDVDAVTRLAARPRVHSVRPGAVVLAPETWSPINTQNTALMAAAIPAYYYVRMGQPLQGLRIDRFGDILSGYLVQKCAKQLGHAVRFGPPVAVHRRSAHNLFKDLYFELAGMVIVEEFVPWLQQATISGSSYRDAYAALADAIEAEAHRFRGFVWDEGGRDFLADMARCMRTWLGLVDRLRGTA